MSLQAQPAATGDDENFSAAFAEFSKDEKPAAAPDGGQGDGPTDNGDAVVSGDGTGDGAPAADPVAAPEGNAGEAPVAEPSAAANAGGEPAPAGDQEPAVKPPAAGAEPAAPADADAVLERLAALVKNKPAAAEPAPAAEPQAEELPPLYSQDEQEFLAGYEKDWGDVSRAEALKRREFGRDLVQYVFNQIGPRLQEMRELTDALANRAHFKDLSEKIGPIDEQLQSQVDAWVEKQPGYLQTTYKQVLTTGTVEEVADLIDRFKKETGVTAASAQAPSKGGSELSGAAKQAAEDLAPVSTKRSVIEQQDDPNDFGAAFAKFNEMFRDK